jgi:hypothetical protein
VLQIQLRRREKSLIFPGMKPILLLFCALFTLSTLRAADEPRVAAVKAADDQRVAGTVAGDRAKLSAVFSDDLRYAHSTGVVDTKSSLIDAITSGKTKYLGIKYDERNVTFPSSGIALITGQVNMKVANPAGDQENKYSFLAVWREEKGQWRFLAWQSCKLLPPGAK